MTQSRKQRKQRMHRPPGQMPGKQKIVQLSVQMPGKLKLLRPPEQKKQIQKRFLHRMKKNLLQQAFDFLARHIQLLAENSCTRLLITKTTVLPA